MNSILQYEKARDYYEKEVENTKSLLNEKIAQRDVILVKNEVYKKLADGSDSYNKYNGYNSEYDVSLKKIDSGIEKYSDLLADLKKELEVLNELIKEH